MQVFWKHKCFGNISQLVTRPLIGWPGLWLVDLASQPIRGQVSNWLMFPKHLCLETLTHDPAAKSVYPPFFIRVFFSTSFFYSRPFLFTSFSMAAFCGNLFGLFYLFLEQLWDVRRHQQILDEITVIPGFRNDFFLEPIREEMSELLVNWMLSQWCCTLSW